MDDQQIRRLLAEARSLRGELPEPPPPSELAKAIYKNKGKIKIHKEDGSIEVVGLPTLKGHYI